ncbi:MAG TPA: hypothetical protein PK544_16265, partial [Spirochaetota bacterium]|nr:hypothetical protein [Spirochaetota bacterium]
SIDFYIGIDGGIPVDVRVSALLCAGAGTGISGFLCIPGVIADSTTGDILVYQVFCMGMIPAILNGNGKVNEKQENENRIILP